MVCQLRLLSRLKVVYHRLLFGKWSGTTIASHLCRRLCYTVSCSLFDHGTHGAYDWLTSSSSCIRELATSCRPMMAHCMSNTGWTCKYFLDLSSIRTFTAHVAHTTQRLHEKIGMHDDHSALLTMPAMTGMQLQDRGK
jgi:hypothetical protein